MLENAFGDPLAAIGGILANLCPCLQADLRDARAFGILQGPAPVTIVDPTLENTVAYSLDNAFKFAITIAPAITVDLDTQNQHTQLCTPVLSCQGLDELGNKVVEEGEILLRAFMLVVLRVFEGDEPRSSRALRPNAQGGIGGHPRVALVFEGLQF